MAAERLNVESLPAAPTAAGPATLRERIDRLAERMTAEQVAEAQRAADAFVETYRYSDPAAAIASRRVDHLHVATDVFGQPPLRDAKRL